MEAPESSTNGREQATVFAAVAAALALLFVFGIGAMPGTSHGSVIGKMLVPAPAAITAKPNCTAVGRVVTMKMFDGVLYPVKAMYVVNG